MSVDDRPPAFFVECQMLEQRWADVHEEVRQLDQEWRRLLATVTTPEGQSLDWSDRAALFAAVSRFAQRLSAVAGEGRQISDRYASTLRRALVDLPVEQDGQTIIPPDRPPASTDTARDAAQTGIGSVLDRDVVPAQVEGREDIVRVGPLDHAQYPRSTWPLRRPVFIALLVLVPLLVLLIAIQQAIPVRAPVTVIRGKPTPSPANALLPANQPARSILLLNPDALRFPIQRPHTTSNIRPVYIVNLGPLSVKMTRIAIAGSNARDFHESDTCTGTVIRVDDRCTIKVRFTPLSSGPRRARIIITDTAAGSPQTVPVSGNDVSMP